MASQKNCEENYSSGSWSIKCKEECFEVDTDHEYLHEQDSMLKPMSPDDELNGTLAIDETNGMNGSVDTDLKYKHEPLQKKSILGTNRKRVRRFQMGWKKQYPWIDYIGEFDLFNGIMVCRICRENREHADINSKFLQGTNTFRIGAIDAHNISRGHENCVAKKLMESVCLDESMKNLLKMSEECSTRIRLRKKQRERNKKMVKLMGNLVNGSNNDGTVNVSDEDLSKACDQEQNSSVDGGLDNSIGKQSLKKISDQNEPRCLSDSKHDFTPKRLRVDKDYDNLKRIRRFQSTWKIEYPWLEYFGDADLHSGFMVCTVCRLYPEIADQSSNFFSGTSSFRKGGIESHNVSAAHRACVCRKVLDSMDQQQLETTECCESSHTMADTVFSVKEYEPKPSDIQKMKEYFSRGDKEDYKYIEGDYQDDLPGTSNQNKSNYNGTVSLLSTDKRYSDTELNKQVPIFQVEWKTVFPWVRYIGSNDCSSGEMYCKLCRMHPQVADTNSQLFNGTSTFYKHLLEEHMDSRSHNLCVARQLHDESLADSTFHVPPSKNQTSSGPQAKISCKPYTPMFRRYTEKRRHSPANQQSNTINESLYTKDLNSAEIRWRYEKAPKVLDAFDPLWKDEFVWLDYEGAPDLVNGVMVCKLCQCYPDDSPMSEFLHGTKHFSRKHLLEHSTSTGHRAAVCYNFLAMHAKEKKSSFFKRAAVTSGDQIRISHVSKAPGYRRMIKRAVTMEEFSVMREMARSAIDDAAEDLNTISQEIWSNPELAFQEHHAHKILTDFLEKQGFEVERNYILGTAFRATWGTNGGITIGILCEYDALPGIGHACGHNLIAECGVAAALGLKAALELNLVKDLNAKIVVLGTPAEEGGGGKCAMIEKGAFDGLDVALMAHPYAYNVSRPQALSMLELNIVYHGKSAHAAAAPWEGVNALDAAVSCYTSMSNLRQQIKPDWRLHGIITNGGLKPNIIPDKAELLYYLRAPDEENLAVLKEKAIACAEGAAKASGCEVEIKQPLHYKNLVTNSVLISLYERHAESLGVDFSGSDFAHTKPIGSTDMGNVTYVVPGIHPKFDIVTDAPNHSTKFTESSGAPEAQGPTLIQAKALALTALDLVHPGNEGLILSIRKEFQEIERQEEVNEVVAEVVEETQEESNEITS
ncbi:uncharacterized protein LOC117113283 isoform X2 [Anneissia japonica]|uniref:uncharacterized protein LOC117113283 isoform X2 n=1 Tax=Anneissia japonica TaxID=1529436 RepID=UPI0014257DB7|nr:uncharacterized protein LOC117113283 isoform X2 [Anneissia japonica]